MQNATPLTIRQEKGYQVNDVTWNCMGSENKKGLIRHTQIFSLGADTTTRPFFLR